MENKIEPDLLTWTTGAVKGFCGKELINLETGGLKLIKIEPRANYPEHIHPNNTEYAYILEGNPEFIIDAELHKSKPGDFFIFPQMIKHSISNRNDVDCIILVGALKNNG